MTRKFSLLLASFVPALILAGCEKTPPAAEKTAVTAAAPAPTPSAAPLAAASAAAPAADNKAGKPLTIAYSDWPGWVAWDIATQKGWFKEAGVEVDLKWFEYAPSMD